MTWETGLAQPPDLEAGPLMLRVDRDRASRGEPITVSWLGRSVMAAPHEVLGPYLRSLSAAAESSGRGIEFHFERLEYFGSATVSVLMSFIRELESRHIALRILYNSGTRLQRSTFEAIKQLAADNHLCEITGHGIQ